MQSVHGTDARPFTPAVICVCVHLVHLRICHNKVSKVNNVNSV